MRLVTALFILVSCSFLSATADEIRDGVLSNILEFVSLRDSDPTLGNQYAFDDYLIPSDASPHTVMSPQCAQWIRSSLTDSNEERIVGHISGVLRSNNQPLANQPIIVTNLSSGDIFELNTDASGLIQFDNYYINACAYEIKHTDEIYYERVVNACIDITGNADLGMIDFSAPQSVVYVDKDPSSNACHTIANAFKVSMSLGIPHIVVRHGTYNERVSVNGLGNSFQNFVLEGQGTVVIHSDVRGRPLSFYNSGYSDMLDELTIKNIIFEDSDIHGGGGVSFRGKINHVTMEQCTVRNCGDHYFVYGSDSIPTGLSSSVPIHINDCDFYNNEGDAHGEWCHSLGAVCVSSSSDANHTIIENSRFYNNYASDSSAIYVFGKGLFTIRNNTFHDNFQGMSDCTSCVTVRNATNTVIENNIFESNYPPYPSERHQYAIKVWNITNDPSTALIKNNTIVSQRHGLNIYNADVVATNNVFDISRKGIYCSQSYDQSRLQFSYNIMKLGTNAIATENYDINQSANQYNQFCDPQLDSDYQPIWTASTMSPCIDTGTGVNDPDGTPADIGALRAISHQYWDYSFENQHDKEKWYWVSYPVLNNVSTDALKASEFFEELLHKHQILEYGTYVWAPTYLDELRWGDDDEQCIKWFPSEYSWTPNQNSHYVSSPQGYKIKLQTPHNPDFPWPVNLVESGFRTPATTEFPIHAGVENWLGYFLEDARMPREAFASIWDDIISIKAKNWSLVRPNPVGDYYGMHGKVSSLRYGDMVIVRTRNEHPNFQWTMSCPEIPWEKATPEKFVFDEKQDYIPVYITLSDSLKIDLKEIGLYVDGVCKGAVVVEDSLEQISAYVDDAAELSEGNVEFVLYYYDDGKSLGNEPRSMSIRKNGLQAKYGDAGSSHPYFDVKFSPEDVGNIIPPEFSLRQNYPNPFNPTTTIAYSLPEAAKVRLDIYNVKGQLVKTLVNAEMPAGMHSVVWNGRDSNNAAVASGVYFYRVSSPKATQTKRMLLMK